MDKGRDQVRMYPLVTVCVCCYTYVCVGMWTGTWTTIVGTISRPYTIGVTLS